MTRIAIGCFVVGRKGQVGVACERSANTGRIRVQYGPYGPSDWTSDSFLRHATRMEVVAAGLDGVSAARIAGEKPTKRTKTG